VKQGGPVPGVATRIDAVTSAYVQQDMPADARGSCGPAQPRAAGNERPERPGRAAPWSGSRGAQLPADFHAVVLEFEGTVQRVARLVLRASALLDRAAKTIGDAPVCGEERVRHLEWAIDAGQKALQAAASLRLDTEMSQGSSRPAARSLRDRAMSTSQSLPTRDVHRRGGRGG